MDELVNKKIEQVLAGDQDAYEDIVLMYQERVYFVCYKILYNAQEAEDAAQEAFLRAYMNLEKFDQSRKFSTWIFRIATNLCIDKLRKKKPDYSLDANIPGTEGMNMYATMESEERLPDEKVASMELGEQIQYALQQLPDTYRPAVVLRYMEERSLKEISDILNLPLNTVKSRVYRGRELLREQLMELERGGE